MIIYKTTNLINGKFYIGKDKRNDPNYYGSGKYYKKAEKKYGKENFRKTIIDIANSRADLCLKEIFWISFYDARNSDVGYNFAKGGEGDVGPFSEEHKRKIGLSNIGKRKGLKASAETKLKISVKQKGNKNASGKRSDETKMAMRLSQMGNTNALGCKYSEETKKRLSELRKRRFKICLENIS